MATTIEVNKSSIKELLMTGSKEKFLIPEYQRPYAWTDDQVLTLFEDLAEYPNNQKAEQLLVTIAEQFIQWFNEHFSPALK